MDYVVLVGSEGAATPEDLAAMHAAWPAWDAEIERVGMHLGIGRELDFPPAPVTVRVRGGETLVTDGPFAETKEYLAGFELVSSDDLAAVLTLESKSPVVPFNPLEVRPSPHGVRLGALASAFGRSEDAAGRPYLFAVWAAESAADGALERECAAWRDALDARGSLVLGAALADPDSARTLRFRDGEVQISDGPFIDPGAFVASIDVVVCAERREAIELAASHPLAPHHAIEVRPFYSA